MKLLFFSPYFHPYTSGITTYPLALFSDLVNDNLVTVLTFPHKDNLEPFEALHSIHIHRMPYLFTVSKGFISPQSLTYFWKEADKTDIVILNIPNFEGLALALIAKLKRKKIVSIFHCKVHLGHTVWNRVLSFFLNLSVKIQLALSDTIVVYTSDYAKAVGVWNQHKKKITEVLPPVPRPTVDSAYKKELKEKKKKRVWIGYAGRVSQEKGLENLVKAVSLLSKNAPKATPFEVVFAGPYGADVAGELAYYHKIVKLLKKYGISYSFLGTLQGGKLGAFYEMIDVLTLPSVNRTEAFGMVQAEAMMSGTPVVVSDLPGVRVPVKLTGMGLVSQPGKPKMLANAIEKVLANPLVYSDTKKKLHAQSIFSIENTVLLYRSLLSSLAKKPKRGKEKKAQ